MPGRAYVGEGFGGFHSSVAFLPWLAQRRPRAPIVAVMQLTCQAYGVSVGPIARGVLQGCACVGRVRQGLEGFKRVTAAVFWVVGWIVHCMCSLLQCTSSSAGLTIGLCLCNSCSHNFPPALSCQGVAVDSSHPVRLSRAVRYCIILELEL